jgi:prepilin-type processing-associated H-X9-DG protein
VKQGGTIQEPTPLRRHRHQTSGIAGFTVIELLFVLVVIGLLLAILLPVLLHAVDGARRIRCANNMHQLSLALQSYHDIHRSLPPAWVCEGKSQNTSQWGWNALSLRLLEQNALYESLQPGPMSIADLFALGPTGEQWLSCTISTLQCKGGGTGESHPTRHFDQAVGVRQGWQPPASNYVANIGFFCRTADYENHGVMYGNSAIPMRAIVDGTSSTFFFGERDALGGGATWVGVADPQDSGANGFGWVGGVVSVPINCPAVEGCRDQGFASQHPGGSQFAFCDGSVRFISETIDFNNGSANRFDSTSDTLLTDAEKAELGVYQRLGVRDDERPISRMP